MKIRDNWRDLLAETVEGRGGNRAALSQQAGLNKTYLRDILERNQTPGIRSAEKLSQGLGIRVTDWFLEPESAGIDGVTHSSHDENGGLINPSGRQKEVVLDTGAMPRDMPVLGIGACGKDGEFELSGQRIDYVRRPPRLASVRDAYALYISGNSMSPWREAGKLVYVHPHAPVHVGDYVVVQLKPKKPGDAPRALIKRLERRTAGDLRLKQFNPARTITVPMKDVASIQKILDWDDLLGI